MTKLNEAEVRERAVILIDQLRDSRHIHQTQSFEVVAAMCENASDKLCDLLTLLDEKDKVIGRLREAEIDARIDAFCEIGFKINDGSDRDGWWDSCARSDACEHGNWLVENAGWERHPDGYGRRWFYRSPDEAAEAARNEKGDTDDK